MSKRLPLCQQLVRAWTSTVQGPYSNQLMTSERGLQVHFCEALAREFMSAEVQRRLFVEPTFVFPDGQRRMPDLVICNSERIIGVVELKYAPRTTPEFSKDLQTLNLFASAKGNISLSCERYRGPKAALEIPLAEDAVLCWAGIYANRLLDFKGEESLLPNFLRLDAITHESQEATVFPKQSLPEH